MNLENDEADINPYTAPDSDFLDEEDTSDFRHGKFWQRVVAWVIDSVLILFSEIFIFNVYVHNLNLIFTNYSPLDSLLAILLFFIIPFTIWIYYAVMESSSYQATIGKILLGLRVTDVSMERISRGRATLRFFAKIPSMLLLGIGYLIQPFTKRGQALHDLLAGTYVIPRD